MHFCSFWWWYHSSNTPQGVYLEVGWKQCAKGVDGTPSLTNKQALFTFKAITSCLHVLQCHPVVMTLQGELRWSALPTLQPWEKTRMKDLSHQKRALSHPQVRLQSPDASTSPETEHVLIKMGWNILGTYTGYIIYYIIFCKLSLY